MKNEGGGFVVYAATVVLWFMVLAATNALDDQPVRSIFPYLLPVLFVAWRNGVGWGFGVASVAALTSGVGSIDPGMEAKGYLWPVITTYLKISGAVIGLCIGKYLAGRPASNQ